MVSGCSSSPDIPLWFDSIERLPVRTVIVDGQRIAHLDAGQGPPVILIHGFGGSMWQWEYQQEVLAAHHRVITLDLLGSGLSDKPDIEYRPDQILSSFRGFMDALGISRATLIGNSMGAGLAIGMALSHPERVDQLVLISGFPDRITERLTSPLIGRAINTKMPAWLVTIGSWFFGRSTMETVLKEIVYDHSLLTPAVIARSNRNRQRLGQVAPILAVGRNLPLWEEGYAKQLGEIRQRTLILWGEEDRVFPAQVGRDLQRVIPSSTLVLIPKAGHIPQWERPEDVNPLIVNFLKH
jgi:pimeloyl-ACP methyl ester carboxylesterase